MSSSQLHVSIPVLPPPMTVYPDAGSSGATRSLGGTTAASASMPKPGVCVDGIEDSVIGGVDQPATYPDRVLLAGEE